MSKYPTEITTEVLEKNANITTDEIIKDIKDTELEIINLKKEIEGHKLIAESTRGSESRMASFRRDTKQSGLNERCEFVQFLQTLLQERKTIYDTNRT